MKIRPPDFLRPEMAQLNARINYNTKTGASDVLTEGEILLKPIYSRKGFGGYADDYVIGCKKTKTPYYVYFKRTGGELGNRDFPSTLILKDSGEMWLIPEEGDTAYYGFAKLSGKFKKAK